MATTVGLKLIFEGKDEPISILRYAWIGTIRFEELWNHQKEEIKKMKNFECFEGM